MFSEAIISDSSIRLPQEDTSVNYFFHFSQNINSFLFQNFKCRVYVSPLRNFFSDFPAAPRRGSVFCGLRNFRLLFLLSNALFSSDLRFPPTFFRGKQVKISSQTISAYFGTGSYKLLFGMLYFSLILSSILQAVIQIGSFPAYSLFFFVGENKTFFFSSLFPLLFCRLPYRFVYLQPTSPSILQAAIWIFPFLLIFFSILQTATPLFPLPTYFRLFLSAATNLLYFLLIFSAPV